MFDGLLGKYTGSNYTIKLKEDSKPYHANSFPVPNIHKLIRKKQIIRLNKIGVLKKINNSQWIAPTFIIPKNNSTVRFIFDFREPNKRIKKKIVPISKHSTFIA